jgi:hypothetical protein
MVESQQWYEIALEVIRAARNRISIRDFEMQCRLAPVYGGKGYHDRLRVAERLITDRIIEKDNGYLRLSIKDIPKWLVDGLEVGSEISWEILENIDPTRKLNHKFDRLLLEKIGLDGEMIVMDFLSNNLTETVFNKVRHISITDDSAGYDIQSPSINNSSDTFFLEVKTSSRPGNDFHFFISKNEARVAAQNDNWRLVGVIRKVTGYELLGSIHFSSFSQFLPTDNSTNGRWESASISIPSSLFVSGLP